MFQASNPVTEHGTRIIYNFLTGLHFERHLTTCKVLKTRYSLLKQKQEMMCIVNAAHI